MSISRVSSHEDSGGGGGGGNSNSSSSVGRPSGNSSASVCPQDVVVAQYEFVPSKRSQLRLLPGDFVYVLSKHESGWWDGLVMCSERPERPERSERATASGVRCMRGWFPQNYTRPYKDKRGITLAAVSKAGAGASAASRRGSAAATATALLQAELALRSESPLHSNASPSSHLKQDYRLDMRQSQHSGGSRRQSLVSGMSGVSAPSNASNLSGTPSAASTASPTVPAAHQLQIDPLQKMPADENRRRKSQAADSAKMNVLSLEEVEMIFGNIHNDSPPIWSPVPTSEGKVIFYNRDYNIYCRTLPFLHNPSLNKKSVFSDYDWYVDLFPRNLKLMNTDKTKVFDTSSLTSTETDGAQALDARGQAGNGPPFPGKNFARRVSATGRGASLDDRSKLSWNKMSQGSHITSSVGGMKGNPNTSEHDHQTINTKQSSKGERDSSMRKLSLDITLPANRELFYLYRTDVGSWSDLRNSTLHHARNAYASFFQNDHRTFTIQFEQATKFCIHYHMAFRLLREQVLKSGPKGDIKRTLNRLADAVESITIDANLYFSSPQRLEISVTQQQVAAIHKSSVGSASTAVHEPIRVSVSTINPSAPITAVRNASTSTTDTLRFKESMAQQAEMKDDFLRDRFQNLGSNSRSQSTRGSVFQYDEGSTLSVQNLFQAVDTSFGELIRVVWLLHKLVKESFTEDLPLPQLNPRLFRGVFDGGSWTNAFLHCDDEITRFSSVGAFPPGSADSAPKPFGSISSKATTLDGSWLSKGSSELDKAALKEVAKAKTSRKNKFPLNEETMLSLRKHFQYFSATSYQSFEKLINQPKTKRRNLEISANCYKGLSQSVRVLDILESLDLRFFVNLRDLALNTEIDEESQELRQHALVSAAPLLLEFYDMKQTLHDVFSKNVICLQNITVEDPYVFSAMRGDLVFGLSPEYNRCDTPEEEVLTEACRRELIREDVESNDFNYQDTDVFLKKSQAEVIEVVAEALRIVEQLVKERENVLNFAARMMKNDLIANLLMGEQERWFDEGDADSKLADSELEQIGFRESLGRSFSKDIPWYLDSEHEYSLIYDNNGRVKGGTRDALLEHLTSHQLIDAPFNIAFLVTFRSMFTTSEFLHALMDRYSVYPPEGLSYDEYNSWVEKKAEPTKARVVNIMKTLFSHYWTPAYYEPGIDDVISFAQLAVAQDIPNAPALLAEAKERLSLKGNLQKFVPNTITFDNESLDDVSSEHSNRLPWTNSTESMGGYGFRMRKLKLLNIDPHTFAKQLTIKEHNLYCKITPFECLDRIWSKKFCHFGGSQNISAFISSANSLTNFVSYSIVRQLNLKKRAKIIQHFISIAEYCFELNNFSSMTAIISALYSSPIYRLKKTWSVVPDDVRNVLDRLNMLMDSMKNFVKYREWLKGVHDVPCVPFFGVYLSDLTFTAQGNPDNLHRTAGIVNFSKRSRVVDILKEISDYQYLRYKFKRYDDIEIFINEVMKHVPSIEKQYEQSLLVEPRPGVSTGLKPPSRAASIASSKTGVAGLKSEKLSRFGRSKKKTSSAG
ncbi:LAMI_0H14026g1_1 [Lachancea mirantina]|uniref:LAMI_0H14026g1_1 n=1 Tax=Lachancea mirantina TaxID=1230905 RepID=A0A1G4KI85_9SACH|nr:LAMI_0H14026g1_1 [Lachancea mirantina]